MTNDIEREEAVVLATLLARLAGKDQFVWRGVECGKYVVHDKPCSRKLTRTLIRVTIEGKVFDL